MPQTLLDQGLFLLVVIGAITIPAILWRRDVLKPGSFHRAGLREVDRVPGLAWMAAAVLLFTAVLPGQAVGQAVLQSGDPSAAARLMEGKATFPEKTIVAGGGYFGQIIAGALLLYLFRARVGAGSGITWRWWDPLLGLGLLALMVPDFQVVVLLAQQAAELLSSQPLDAIAHDTLREMLDERESPWFWGMLAVVVIGAPVTEELVFRLFFQSAILRWTGSAWAAIGATAITFGLIHLGSTPWYGIVPLAFFGVVLGIVFERTKRIGVPIVMHAAFNAGQVALALYIDGLTPP